MDEREEERDLSRLGENAVSCFAKAQTKATDAATRVQAKATRDDHGVAEAAAYERDGVDGVGDGNADDADDADDDSAYEEECSREERYTKAAKRLKDAANEHFKSMKLQEALSLYKESLKCALKAAVPVGTPELRELMLANRNNMCQVYMLLGDYENARIQGEAALDLEPNNLKALWRMAKILFFITDYAESLKLLNTLEASAREMKEGRALRRPGTEPEYFLQGAASLRERIAKEEKSYLKQQKSLFRRMLPSKIASAKMAGPKLNAEGKAVKAADGVTTMHGQNPLLLAAAAGSRPPPREAPVALQEHPSSYQELEAQEELESSLHLIKFGFLGRKAHPGEERSTADPWHAYWRSPHDVKSLKEEKSIVELSIPYTFLYSLYLLLRHPNEDAALVKLYKSYGIWDEKAKCPSVALKDYDATIEEDPLFYFDQATADLPRISRVASLFGPETDHPSSPHNAKLQRLLTRRRLYRSIVSYSRLRIHVIGAHSQLELQAQWSAIVALMPRLTALEVICVGFMDGDDPWSNKLVEGIMSPPLVKTIGLPDGKSCTVRLFRGLYQLLLQDSGIIDDPGHPYYPDAVMIVDPGFDRYFDSWVEPIAVLIRKNIPLLFTSLSALEQPSHDLASLPHVIKALEGTWLIEPRWNPFMIRIKPSEDLPPMPLWEEAGKWRMYEGQSAKNAAIGWVYGCAPGSEDKASNSAFAPDFVQRLREKLQKACDIGFKPASGQGADDKE